MEKFKNKDLLALIDKDKCSLLYNFIESNILYTYNLFLLFAYLIFVKNLGNNFDGFILGNITESLKKSLFDGKPRLQIEFDVFEKKVRSICYDFDKDENQRSESHDGDQSQADINNKQANKENASKSPHLSTAKSNWPEIFTFPKEKLSESISILLKNPDYKLEKKDLLEISKVLFDKIINLNV